MNQRHVVTALAIGAALGSTALDSSAQVTAADGAPFVGNWDLPLSAQGQSFTIAIDIGVADDMLVATVSGFEGGNTEVDEIDLHDNGSLSLEYEGSAQGQSFPVELTLTPEGEAMDAEMDIADGMFAIDGTASRRAQ